ncbi:multidrug transporter [Tardibacter chloracetimidivorans]|uniref:Multidrug transporter n=1 Tax=Tardibacter chloracetimidivorans TaxID=1921510 RepID=A0A1L3ZTD8_9SPHN|nr:SapC family protein [Tardibacter chloracetimidivorans]API58906.1 multidrug transporter [Tardibacter chloracetimidivorans]
MASAAQNALPVLYVELEPLSSTNHAGHRLNPKDALQAVASLHAVPLTVDEFVLAQRDYPIIFTSGPNPVPLALMGLHEGMNLFVDAEGRFRGESYIPAYLRRYPFLLARLRPDSEELSLCFDPSSGIISAEGEGDPLFSEGQPSETTKAILNFCEQFEQSGARTAALIADLDKNGLLIDGEVSIQPEGADKPFVYRGFRMVAEDKLRELRGDVSRKMIQSGAMGLIYAHLFSLSLIRDLFTRQMAEGNLPPSTPAGDAPASVEGADQGVAND